LVGTPRSRYPYLSSRNNTHYTPVTDSEATLQAIRKWIGCGAKLNLSKYRGDPLNEEADIRAEMGHSKEQKEVILDKRHFEH
jgi:ribonuclease HI